MRSAMTVTPSTGLPSRLKVVAMMPPRPGSSEASPADAEASVSSALATTKRPSCCSTAPDTAATVAAALGGVEGEGVGVGAEAATLTADGVFAGRSRSDCQPTIVNTIKAAAASQPALVFARLAVIVDATDAE